MGSCTEESKPAWVDLALKAKRLRGRHSRRTAAVGMHFGITLDGGEVTILDSARVPLGPGRILAIVGPSGAGKTTALGQIARRCPTSRMVHRVLFPPEAAIIDRIAPGADLAGAISLLTRCGLGDAHLWVRRFHELSDGEKFRARLARAVSDSTGAAGASPLLCDEFCSSLHRRAAKAISFGLRRLATEHNLSVVVACSNEDLLADLQPNTIARLSDNGRSDVLERTVKSSTPFSYRRRLRIEPGSKRDYDAFRSMHYRATDELGFVDKVFIVRDGPGGEPVGIVVYSHAPLELSLRNQATDGWFSRNHKRVNRSLRILRRLVIHPDLRGCGLGHWFVRKTLPLVGTKYVECLAAMGEFNPIFEKAGMPRIGQYELSRKRIAAMHKLESMGVDPNRREFPAQVCRRPSVRKIVAQVVYDWYMSTTAGGSVRVARQSPEFLAQTFRGLIGSRPVYYLWKNPKAA